MIAKRRGRPKAQPKVELKLSRKLTPAARAKFLDLVAQGKHSQVSAAEKVGISYRATLYARQKDHKFDDQCKEAIAHGHAARLGLVDDEIFRRAVSGYLKPVYYKGRPCGVVREYSDPLLALLAKRLDPAYREGPEINTQVTVSGVLRVPPMIELDEWERRIAERTANGPPALPGEFEVVE